MQQNLNPSGSIVKSLLNMNGRGRLVAGEDELVLKVRSAIKQAWDYSFFRTKNLPRVLKGNLLIYLCRDVLQGLAVLNHSCLFQMRGIISSHVTMIFILRMMVTWRMRNHSIPRNYFCQYRSCFNSIHSVLDMDCKDLFDILF